MSLYASYFPFSFFTLEPEGVFFLTLTSKRIELVRADTYLLYILALIWAINKISCLNKNDCPFVSINFVLLKQEKCHKLNQIDLNNSSFLILNSRRLLLYFYFETMANTFFFYENYNHSEKKCSCCGNKTNKKNKQYINRFYSIQNILLFIM